MRLQMRRRDKASDGVACRPRPPARTEFSGNQARLRELSALRLQAKLNIGAVNDPLEREADRTADQVMRTSTPSIGAGAVSVARKCAQCMEADQAGSSALRRDAAGRDDPLAGAAAPEAVTDVLRDSGRPLDPATRNFMEAGFGFDFDGVRVHDDAKAAASARGVAARAYTVGSHVAFDSGAYRPGDPQGDRLLAHELAHVVQQSATDQAGAPSPADARGTAGAGTCRGGRPQFHARAGGAAAWREGGAEDRA
jgi:hypothetical protein